ncbi:MAG: hypothetical protein JW976_09335, partial [Syntrophaceae bacterium]|nr:hypothetical protein [Syntrophaceae bacterium]
IYFLIQLQYRKENLMAKISEVRHILRSVPNVKVSRKREGLFYLSSNGLELTVAEAVVDQYLSNLKNARKPHETAIIFPGYYEQAIEFQTHTNITYRIMRDGGIKMENKEKTRMITVASISNLFSLALLDSDDLSQDINRFINMSRNLIVAQQIRRGYDGEQTNSISSLLGRIITIRIEIKHIDPISTNEKRLHELCEAALFHIAYGWGVGISLSTSWEKAYYRFGLRRQESVQFPLRTYNSELLSYYHLAFGSDSLILAYIALYKNLEYFFTSASEKLLHSKISEVLVEPDFHHKKPKKLRELVKTIRSHDSRMDEKRMLTTVLLDFFQREILENWIIKYDSENDHYYTTEHQVFAETVRIDLSNNQNFFSSIANRIYHIRNALVHYKEGEVSRFVPFSGQEEVLFKEIPLLLFIAEQLIIKTGEDI